jgi:hypothetical protein
MSDLFTIYDCVIISFESHLCACPLSNSLMRAFVILPAPVINQFHVGLISRNLFGKEVCVSIRLKWISNKYDGI